MKSIKPGRGPSALGAFVGIFVALFGVFWTVSAASMGAPSIFPLFGVFFVIIAVVQIAYNLNNAAAKNRMSVYDITDDNEEVDPIQKLIDDREDGRNNSYRSDNVMDESSDINYCPYCGKHLDQDYVFCPKCGKQVKG
ncbi:MAG: zinc-ribbon domain-containing protein [Bacillota bacterium]